MKQLKGCLFDLDGVLVETAKFHYLAWRKLAQSLGFDITEHQNEQLKGISRTDSLDLILQWGGKRLSVAEKQVLATTKNDDYLQLITAMGEGDLLPGVASFLEGLQAQGIKIALGSASKNARTILERVGWLDKFDAIVDGNDVTHSKPHPEVFLKGAELLGLSPEECWVFEDADKGVEAAKAGGFWAIGIGQAHILHQADVVLRFGLFGHNLSTLLPLYR